MAGDNLGSSSHHAGHHAGHGVPSDLCSSGLAGKREDIAAYEFGGLTWHLEHLQARELIENVRVSHVPDPAGTTDRGKVGTVRLYLCTIVRGRQSDGRSAQPNDAAGASTKVSSLSS